jgi:hypothetical protein
MEGYVTKDAIIQVSDLPFEDVSVPEWGGKVRIRLLTGEEIDAYHGSMFEMKGDKVIQNRDNFRTKLLVRCLCDGEGNRLFKDSELGLLAGKSGAVINRLYGIASRINALEEKAGEELEKN